jgi:hypothetical protein
VSNSVKGYFIAYGGYLHYLEAERNVPSNSTANKVLWGLVLAYSMGIAFILYLSERENRVKAVDQRTSSTQ